MYLLFLIIPIILFYILKLRVNTAITATAFLWKLVLQEQRSAQHWQIRRIISLLLSILFISLLALAVWNPTIHLPAMAADKPKEGVQLAITCFTQRRSSDEPVNYEVLVEVENKGTQTAETMLGVQLENRLLSAVPFTIPANSVQQTVIRDTSPLGGTLQCALIEQEQTNRKNGSRQREPIQAATVLPPVEVQKILLCGNTNIFLKNALQSLPDTEVITVQEIPQIISKEVILVLNGNAPSELPTGNILIFNPQNDTQLFTVGEPLGVSLVEETDASSPLVKQLGLQNTLLQGAKEITPEEITPKETGGFNPRSPVKILAETSDGQPLYLLFETAERKVLVFNADLQKSGITSQTTFPLLLGRAVRYFNDKEVADKEAGGFSPRNDKFNSYWQGLKPPVSLDNYSFNNHSLQFPLTTVCLFWTAMEWFLFQRRKLE